MQTKHHGDRARRGGFYEGVGKPPKVVAFEPGLADKGGWRTVMVTTSGPGEGGEGSFYRGFPGNHTQAGS